jgi:hypothetical protein
MSDDADGALKSVATGTDAPRNVSGLVDAIWAVLPISDQIMLWLGVAFVLIAPTTIGLITTNSTSAWVATVCGAFVTLMSRFANLTELSLGPVKAKMREAAQETLYAAQNIARAQAEVKVLPDSPSKDVIATTTNAAMEAVTAAIKANEAVTITSTTSSRFPPPTSSKAVEHPWPV